MKKSKVLATSALVLAGTLALGNFVFAGGGGDGLTVLPFNLTKATAANAVEKAESGAPALPSEGSFAFGRGHGGGGRNDWSLNAHIGGLELDLAAIAQEALGMTADEVAAKLQENGYDVSALLTETGALEKAQAIIAAKLETAVADGKVTQEQADKILEDVTALFGHGAGAIKAFGGFGGGLDIGSLFGADGEFALPEGLLPAGLEDMLPAFGKNFRADPGKAAPNARVEFYGVNATDVAADVLGMTAEEFQTALSEKQGDLRALLEEYGVTETVKARLQAEIEAKSGDIADQLIDGVKSGRNGARVFPSGVKNPPAENPAPDAESDAEIDM